MLFNTEGSLLLQKRADHKYHSPGLWTNTCCSHPRPSETVQDAASRRLMEEMGMRADLTHVTQFQYFVNFENGLKENEIDHILIGLSDILPLLNQEEVSEYKYISWENLENDIEAHPENYTEWFKIILSESKEIIKSKLDELIPVR